MSVEFAARPTPQQDWKMVNCAGCGEELFGRKFARTKGIPMDVRVEAGRINDRPYCYKCLSTSRKSNRPATREDGPSPYQENAIRAMEENS